MYYRSKDFPICRWIASLTPATLEAPSARGQGQGQDHRSGKRVSGMLLKEVFRW